MKFRKASRIRLAVGSIAAAGVVSIGCAAEPDEGAAAASEANDAAAAGAGTSGQPQYRSMLGEDNPKIRRDGERTYIYAGGDLDTGEADWFEFTGAPIDPTRLQFGIGKHRIPSIDDPVFVPPDDPRLLAIPTSRYRPEEIAETNDEIMVVGYVENDVAKAYPIALLDHHEVVNDRIEGKPVAVGW